MNLEEILKEFLFDCKLRKLSQRTIKSYRNNNQVLFRFISLEYKITKVEDDNHKVLQCYINFLTETGRKEYYINVLIKSFRAYFAYYVNERYININPLNKVRSQKQPISVINTYTVTFRWKNCQTLSIVGAGRKFQKIEHICNTLFSLRVGVKRKRNGISNSQSTIKNKLRKLQIMKQ